MKYILLLAGAGLSLSAGITAMDADARLGGALRSGIQAFVSAVNSNQGGAVPAPRADLEAAISSSENTDAAAAPAQAASQAIVTDRRAEAIERAGGGFNLHSGDDLRRYASVVVSPEQSVVVMQFMQLIAGSDRLAGAFKKILAAMKDRSFDDDASLDLLDAITDMLQSRESSVSGLSSDQERVAASVMRAMLQAPRTMGALALMALKMSCLNNTWRQAFPDEGIELLTPAIVFEKGISHYAREEEDIALPRSVMSRLLTIEVGTGNFVEFQRSVTRFFSSNQAFFAGLSLENRSNAYKFLIYAIAQQTQEVARIEQIEQEAQRSVDAARQAAEEEAAEAPSDAARRQAPAYATM